MKALDFLLELGTEELPPKLLIKLSNSNTDSELEELEQNIKTQVLKCAPGAVAETKRLIGLIAKIPREEMVSKAGESFAERVLSDEGREGIASFLEKRKPGWSV